MDVLRHEGLYTGSVWHQRSNPEHAFERKILLAYCDLDRLDASPEGRIRLVPGLPAFVRKRDYLGSSATSTLRSLVEPLVEPELGRTPRGPMALLTQPRTFGFTFNPVSFIYCWAESEDAVEAVVAEVTNTPWGERHHYVLTNSRSAPGEPDRFRAKKQLHVSPFFGMDHEYRFQVSKPSDSIRLSIENFREQKSVFKAGLRLTRRSGFGSEGIPTMRSHPFMSMETFFGIYGQAFLLALKRTPFFKHPRRTPLADGSDTTRSTSTQPGKAS